MFIKASMRTDIPSFYSDWFYRRIEEGFVCVRNPYNKDQVTKYILNPEVVDSIIFCTKNPAPMLGQLEKLLPFHPYFHVTITPYGREIESMVPEYSTVLEQVKIISEKLGKERVCWRYDPIFLTETLHLGGKEGYTVKKHISVFEKMAKELSGYVEECIISFVDLYENTKRNLPGIKEVTVEDQIRLAIAFGQIAKKYRIALKSCGEKLDLSAYGVVSIGCLDRGCMEKVVGTTLLHKKEQPNRINCRCMPARDIGDYNTCLNGCSYCYANYDKDTVHTNYKMHNPNSPLLIGELREQDIVKMAKQESYVDGQLRLF